MFFSLILGISFIALAIGIINQPIRRTDVSSFITLLRSRPSDLFRVLMPYTSIYSTIFFFWFTVNNRVLTLVFAAGVFFVVRFFVKSEGLKNFPFPPDKNGLSVVGCWVGLPAGWIVASAIYLIVRYMLLR